MCRGTREKMIRKEILAKREKTRHEIEILNSMRFEEKTDNNSINKKIKELKERYNYYNNLLKAIK